MRASAGASDALEHGVTVLAAGWVIALVGMWGGRRALLSAALGALALVGVLALRDAARTELYVAATGGALLALALAVPRLLPRRLPIHFEWLTESVAVALILSGPPPQPSATAATLRRARSPKASLCSARTLRRSGRR